MPRMTRMMAKAAQPGCRPRPDGPRDLVLRREPQPAGGRSVRHHARVLRRRVPEPGDAGLPVELAPAREDGPAAGRPDGPNDAGERDRHLRRDPRRERERAQPGDDVPLRVRPDDGATVLTRAQVLECPTTRPTRSWSGLGPRRRPDLPLPRRRNERDRDVGERGRHVRDAAGAGDRVPQRGARDRRAWSPTGAWATGPAPWRRTRPGRTPGRTPAGSRSAIPAR